MSGLSQVSVPRVTLGPQYADVFKCDLFGKKAAKVNNEKERDGGEMA